jgi:H+/gluconate symporter-like permease
MFKEYFNLSLRQTFLSWSVMETIVAVVGLLGSMALSYVV